jgi:peroxiredoxin
MPASFPEILASARTQAGDDLLAISRRGPVLVTFLRHLGCTFCREALAALGARRHAIESSGTRLAFVHMGTEEQARALFERYGLGDAGRVADPDRHLYRAFGLERGGFLQLLGPRVVARGIVALLGGYGAGRMAGDGRQLPGVFLLRDGRLVRAFRHETAADRPDYEELAREIGR